MIILSLVFFFLSRVPCTKFRSSASLVSFRGWADTFPENVTNWRLYLRDIGENIALYLTGFFFFSFGARKIGSFIYNYLLKLANVREKMCTRILKPRDFERETWAFFTSSLIWARIDGLRNLFLVFLARTCCRKHQVFFKGLCVCCYFWMPLQNFQIGFKWFYILTLMMDGILIFLKKNDKLRLFFGLYVWKVRK